MAKKGFVIDDKKVIRGLYSTVCNNCANYISGYKCKAFNEIPMEIWSGENKHTKPVRGDNGIRFEAITPTETAQKDYYHEAQRWMEDYY